MTDITELAQSLKAAAENATPGEWCSDDQYGVVADAGLNGNYYIASCSGPEHRSNKRFIALANPANVLALVEALEKALQERENWRTSFDNERFRADKLAATLSDEIEQAANVRGQLLIAHKTLLNQQAKIAELEEAMGG
ncbi:hypothetical protein DOD04_27230 [Klebsiella michiganensis]|nr:hypothetical protein DOD04_27230 [Klebsiella michiganensis]